jgi:hypothetical protein
MYRVLNSVDECNVCTKISLPYQLYIPLYIESTESQLQYISIAIRFALNSAPVTLCNATV